MKKAAFLVVVMTFTVGGCSKTDTEPVAEPVAEPVSEAPVELTAEEQLAAAARECEAAEAEFEARAAEASLYDRLGGRDGIHAIFVEMVGILSSDPGASPMLEGVDTDRMIEVSTDHLASHTGGSEAYDGRDITEVHRRLNIDAEMFLNAGAAFGVAMENTGVAPEEAQEVQCLMIGMRDKVMAPSNAG